MTTGKIGKGQDSRGTSEPRMTSRLFLLRRFNETIVAWRGVNSLHFRRIDRTISNELNRCFPFRSTCHIGRAGNLMFVVAQLLNMIAVGGTSAVDAD